MLYAQIISTYSQQKQPVKQWCHDVNTVTQPAQSTEQLFSCEFIYQNLSIEYNQ